ncbi:ketopantoate reductase C-terminal domain-containing protein [Ensifer adhaerens]|uniref:ketopantoate reductase family protein n=1 Tax=Ensifer adhaerens TaxID=106592 RepID=UPI0015ECC851
MLEAVTLIINAVGTRPAADYLEQITAQLTDESSVQTSLMYRDLPSGRRLEVEEILGDLVRYAEHANLPAPLLAAAYCQLSVHQRRFNHEQSELASAI